MNANYEIRSFPVKTASDAEYRALATFMNRMRAEQLPDDPPLSLEEWLGDFQNIPDFIDVHAWAAWNGDGSAVVGGGWVMFMRTEENKHLAELHLEVVSEYRRQGIARRLLALLNDVAQRENRTLLITNTSERIPAGEIFMRRLGAKRGLENHTNQLVISELNRDLVREWQTRAQQRATCFELGIWEGAYPEEHIEEIAELFRVMNSAPHDDLQVEDYNYTAAHLRQREKSNLARGSVPWTMYVREKATGRFAGFTEVFWHPSRPEILDQGGTGVPPAYRNLGLGRWLKAAMLDKIMRERPQVKYVRTGNADSNAPMLKINHELGFKPYISRCVWQIEVAKVCEYLESSQKSVVSSQVV